MGEVHFEGLAERGSMELCFVFQANLCNLLGQEVQSQEE